MKSGGIYVEKQNCEVQRKQVHRPVVESEKGKETASRQ